MVGLVQGAKAPASSWHWNVLASPAEKLKVGVGSFDGLGGLVPSVTVGATVSIVQTYEVAGPVLPAASVALTV